MNYEYGVEYPCNGKKPDLPDGVGYQIMNDGAYKDKWSKTRRGAKETSWHNVTKFRIVDERYKPKAEESNWFERGELPPVGAICEITHSGQEGKYRKIEILKYDDDSIACIDLCGDFDVCLGDLLWMYQIRDSDVKFRPIRTEREKAIEAATKLYDEKKCFSAESFAGELYDAGLLRLPEGK